MRPPFALSGSWEYLPTSDSLDFAAAMNVPQWSRMTLPANWHLAGLPDYDGVVWFRRRFEVDARAGRPYLNFEGVDYFADVWLNGVFLGHHEGYFAPFGFQVDHALRSGANELVVRVASPREDAQSAWPYKKRLIKGIFNHHDCRPGAWHPAYGQDGNTGGIWNDVFLAWQPDPHLVDLAADVRAHAQGATVTARLAFHAEDPVSHLPVKAWCRDPEGRIVAELAGELPVPPDARSAAWEFDLAEPQWWWSWDHGAQPLYTLEVHLGAQVTKLTFGLRTIRLEQDTWILNGRRVFLRGTNIIPAQWLSCYDREQIDRDVQLMKDAGINIVRVHAHVNRREFYEACDRAGLMVWQDFALQWSYDPSPEFAAVATTQVREMVRHLRAHPSIVAWCCHNEPVGQEHTLDPLLVQAVYAEDASRVVRSHSDFKEHPYQGWYYGHMHEYSSLPGRPLVTEFGAQALPNVETLHEMLAPEDLWPPNWARWSYHDFQYEQTLWIAGVAMGASLEEFVANSQAKQAELIRYAIDAYRRARFAPMTGVFQFMFVDGWPSITWSVVDHARRPKRGYFTLQEVFSPLYLSVRVMAPVVRAGLPLPLDVVLVNDLPQAFAELSILFRLLDEKGLEQVRWAPRTCTIEADESIDLTKLWEGELTTSSEWRGAFELEATCRDGEVVRSIVRLPIRLEILPPELAHYKAVEMR